MARYIRNEMPTRIENTSMVEVVNADTNVLRGYEITPNEGYVLHDTSYDSYESYDNEGNPIGEPILGYRTTTASCGYNYDFEANPRQFYAVLRESVPENQIFGGVTTPPETEVVSTEGTETE